MSSEEILDQRKNKYLKIGRGKGFVTNPESLSSLEIKKNSIKHFFRNKINLLYLLGGLILAVTLLIFFL